MSISIAHLSINRKKLNSKQAHTANPKGKERNAVTLVQIDKNSEFALNEVTAKKFQRLQNDYSWLQKNRSMLVEKYPNKYIAVENESIRFIADSVESLIADIIRTNEQVEDFAIQFLSTRPRNYLF
jgi:hypothetical protein